MTPTPPSLAPPPDLPPFWPNHAHSRRVSSPSQIWHVQTMGQNFGGRASLLLMHGAGGSLHCWGALAPLLVQSYPVIALDVAGHGYSQMRGQGRYGLDAIAADIAALVQGEGWNVQAVIGHSAGAAIGLRLCQHLPLRAVIGLNAALAPFDGLAGWLFPAMAKSLARLPFAPHLAARAFGTAPQIARLIQQTGAKLDAAGHRHYQTLAQNPRHIAATLAMMAAWDLPPLLAALPDIVQPTLLLTGGADGAVPPAVSLRAAQILPHAQAHILPGFGHLLPEETPARLNELILPFLHQHLAP